MAVVLLNIFFSYGMLYLSEFIYKSFPWVDLLFYFRLSSVNSLVMFGSIISTVLISPISEELIFRGVILNKVKKVVPLGIAIMVTSLLFASLHPFGSIVSAFVFALCMCVLYLKSDNIIVPILAHFLNNLLAELIKAFDSHYILFNNSAAVGVMSVLAAISFVIIVHFLMRELNNIK